MSATRRGSGAESFSPWSSLLRCPVFRDASQLRWLEREAEYYKLTELVPLCAAAYDRLDKFQVMQLLNGLRNLSSMGAYASNIEFASALTVGGTNKSAEAEADANVV